MTKQDILKMKTSIEVNRTMFTHPELWDKEVSDYSVKLAKKESLELYGSEDFLPTLRKRKKES